MLSEELWMLASNRELFTETNEQKFSLRGVQCKKICRHSRRLKLNNVR